MSRAISSLNWFTRGSSLPFNTGTWASIEYLGELPSSFNGIVPRDTDKYNGIAVEVGRLVCVAGGSVVAVGSSEVPVPQAIIVNKSVPIKMKITLFDLTFFIVTSSPQRLNYWLFLPAFSAGVPVLPSNDDIRSGVYPGKQPIP
jgi:hypothetical protein